MDRILALPTPEPTNLTYCEYVGRVNKRFHWYRHCEVLGNVLQRVADRELARVMCWMPPRHGKTEQVSRMFPSYWLHRYPEQFVGLNSYAAELAYTLSRAARENFLKGGGDLRDDASAVKHWETLFGGGLWAAGVGGPITGKGFGLGGIDDPIKNAEEAASQIIREKQWEWYGSTFYTREEPGGAILLTLTRWNQDDLAGRLLEDEGGEDPERWHIVCFEAIKEEGTPEVPTTCTLEPDWREPGEALCPERYPLSKLKKIRERIGSYFWNALYQQRPRPKEGGFFKWDWFQLVDAIPAQADRVRYWDLAGTDAGGDFTSGTLMSRSREGLYTIEHVHRGQWSPNRRDQEIVETARRDAAKHGQTGVHIWLEHEAGIGGKERTEAIIRKLAGYRVSTERPTGAKDIRAEPLAAQAEAGNVRMLRDESWNNAFRRTLCDFPHGKHDDDVDSASGAFNKLTLNGPGEFTITRFKV